MWPESPSVLRSSSADVIKAGFVSLSLLFHRKKKDLQFYLKVMYGCVMPLLGKRLPLLHSTEMLSVE